MVTLKIVAVSINGSSVEMVARKECLSHKRPHQGAYGRTNLQRTWLVVS